MECLFKVAIDLKNECVMEMNSTIANESCPQCRDTELEKDVLRGEIYCKKCGKIIYNFFISEINSSNQGEGSYHQNATILFSNSINNKTRL